MTTVDHPAVATRSHPLEPLTADEITAAAALLRTERHLGPDRPLRLHHAARAAEADLLRWNPDAAPLPREAHIVVYERGARATYEAVVSLSERSVLSWHAIEGVQAADHGRGVHGLRGRSSRPTRAGRRRCARRGVEDFSLTMVDPWASS